MAQAPQQQPQWIVPPDLYEGSAAGNFLEMFPEPGTPGTNQPDSPYVDVSLLSPDDQYAYLVDMIESMDTDVPAPFTGTPPWNEYTDPADNINPAYLDERYMPAPDLNANADVDTLSLLRDATPQDYPGSEWENDPQYFGLGVPPGVMNTGQPYETGHTQITPPDPGSEQGWDAWSGRPQLARVARHENAFSQYRMGQSTGHGIVPEKLEMPFALLTQQYRDMLIGELKKRGVHNVVIADVPSVPFTETVAVVDPTVLSPEPWIGPEGVVPW